MLHPRSGPPLQRNFKLTVSAFNFYDVKQLFEKLVTATLQQLNFRMIQTDHC